MTQENYENWDDHFSKDELTMHPVGSLVDWNPEKFTDEQMQTLRQQWGDGPYKVVHAPEPEYAHNLMWALWLGFVTSNGYCRSRPTNLRQWQT